MSVCHYTINHGYTYPHTFHVDVVPHSIEFAHGRLFEAGGEEAKLACNGTGNFRIR